MKYIMNKILIIEDENLTAKSVKEALEINGMKANVAVDGIEGLELLRQEEYDLVLLDLKLPKLSGVEVLKEIRKVRPYIFVIVYTNFSIFADIKTLTNIGVDGYVNKGADANLQELVDMIKGKLEPFSVTDIKTIIDEIE